MCLIRITHGTDGIADYLRDGAKARRKHTRDELDLRVPLLGDLQTLECAVSTTRRTKKWKHHYWHFTIGFAQEDSSLASPALKRITREMLAYYLGHYDIEHRIIAYAEAHRPRLQSYPDASTQARLPRLLHCHAVVSKYDVGTGNQLRMLPYSHEADAAFQSWLARRHGLVDPATCRRRHRVTMARILSRHDGESSGVRMTPTAAARRYLASLLTDADTQAEAFALLEHCDKVAHVERKEPRGGRGAYLKVRMTDPDTQPVNLRGAGFEHLCDTRIAGQASTRPATDRMSTLELEHRFRSHQRWYARQCAAGSRRRIDYAALEVRIAKRHSKNERACDVLIADGASIRHSVIRRYPAWRDANGQRVIGDSEGVCLLDFGDRLVLDLARTSELKAGIQSMLELCHRMSGAAPAIEIGADHPQASLIREAVASFAPRGARPRTTPAPSVGQGEHGQPRQHTQPESVIEQAYRMLRERAVLQASAGSLERMETEIGAADVLAFASRAFGLEPRHYSVTQDNRIRDRRIARSAWTVVEFLREVCNLGAQETLRALEEIERQAARFTFTADDLPPLHPDDLPPLQTAKAPSADSPASVGEPEERRAHPEAHDTDGTSHDPGRQETVAEEPADEDEEAWEEDDGPRM